MVIKTPMDAKPDASVASPARTRLWEGGDGPIALESKTAMGEPV